jgi:hypothetical protein
MHLPEGLTAGLGAADGGSGEVSGRCLGGVFLSAPFFWYLLLIRREEERKKWREARHLDT